jgi:hypothetical protein
MEVKEKKQIRPFLARRIPDLSFDDLPIDIDAARRELDPNGRLRLQAELVAGESGEEVGFANARVSDEDNFEEIIVVIVRSVRHSLRYEIRTDQIRSDQIRSDQNVFLHSSFLSCFSSAAAAAASFKLLLLLLPLLSCVCCFCLRICSSFY